MLGKVAQLTFPVQVPRIESIHHEGEVAADGDVTDHVLCGRDVDRLLLRRHLRRQTLGDVGILAPRVFLEGFGLAGEEQAKEDR